VNPIIFASTSSYKQQQLSALGLKFQAVASQFDEFHDATIPAETLSLQLSKQKAQALQSKYPQHWILGSDQVAMTDNSVLLTKPGSKENAVKQLQASRGRKVSFYSAVTLLNNHQKLEACNQTDVYFRDLTDAEIERYVEADNPIDCAGSFKVEALGISLFERIDSNDPTALIGLPLIALGGLLRQIGFAVP
jgi:septum formation protein